MPAASSSASTERTRRGPPPGFGIWLAVRTSPWLLPLDILAAGGLLLVGVSFARGGSVLDLSAPRVVVRSVHGIVHGVAAAGFAIEPLLRGRRDAARRGG